VAFLFVLKKKSHARADKWAFLKKKITFFVEIPYNSFDFPKNREYNMLM
jgi:hypothetical protein